MTLRKLLGTARAAKIWRPSTLSVFADGALHRKRNALFGTTDRDHLEAAAAWIARAQDAETDGGVSGRYRLGQGWTSSYPETTGYIIPTMLALESEAGLQGFRARAERAIGFLLRVQLESGAFPGLEIAENRDRPSVFNSAQVLNGLTAWHRSTGDETTLRAAVRCADWLTAEQHPDGAWRKHLYGSGKTYTYMAHAGCWLAAFGAHMNDTRYLDAARKHLHWVLTHVDESTGWINDCGFDEPKNRGSAVTHTIAYTIWGVLMMSHILGDERGHAVARRAAHAVANRLGLSKWLPGRLNPQWKGADTSMCLTGNAQMALIWFELNRIEGDPALVNAACEAIDLVKRAQPMQSTDPNIRGGIPGSDPVWGDYIHLALPNWAAKFFIDALLEKQRTLASLAPLPARAHGASKVVTPGVPMNLPAQLTLPEGSKRPRVVLIADSNSHKVEQFSEVWKSWGFKADAVVVRHPADTPRSARVRSYLREYGVGNMVRRLVGLKPPTLSVAQRQGTVPWSGPGVVSYCAANGLPTVTVASLTEDADLERIRALGADLFVFAGGGIIRPKLLALAPLGMLNAHMGLLPQMRGMNVAEWSAFVGAPVGCTVHCIDAGIDTGPIVLFRPVDVSGAPNIDQLRQRVDAAQIRALGEVVQWVRDHGKLPPVYVQRVDEGRQYFAMHDELRAVLQKSLAAGSGS